jgi:CBS domain-containing protein
MSEYRVSSIVRRDTPLLAPTTPIRRAAAVIVDAHAAAAPVLGEDGGLVGILSEKDCFRPALHASYHREWSGTVEDQMSRQVVTVGLEDEVIGVAELFLEQPFRVFPVLDGWDVAGLIYRSDVLRLLMRLG